MSAPEQPITPLPLAEAMRPQWGHERREMALHGVHARRARRTRLTRGGVVASVLLTVLLAFGLSWRARARVRDAGSVASVSQQQVRFSDGSSVHLLVPDAALDIGAASPSAVEVTLRSGSAEFEITPNPARRFIVHAGAADVSVLGTHFRVTREAARVRVEVSHGRVSVTYAGGARLLTDGESNWFPPTELEAPASASSVTLPVASAALATAQPSAGAPPEHAERRRFLEHAAQGEYAEAFAAIERSPDVVGNSADDLLLAADAARFSGHPLEATRYLERVTREHARESVAPLAAFTLGRIEMTQLAQPAKAADAFARALSLAPSGSLAEDALARETEAAELAGQHARAHDLAEQYLQRFPHGRRADSVRKSGGVALPGTNR